MTNALVLSEKKPPLAVVCSRNSLTAQVSLFNEFCQNLGGPLDPCSNGPGLLELLEPGTSLESSNYARCISGGLRWLRIM